MTNESIQMASGIESDSAKTSGDYTVYDAAQVAGNKAAKGFAFLTSAASQAGRYVEVTLDSDGDDLELEKVTSATGRYATPGAAVRHIYVSHDVLAELGGEATDDGFDAPETLGLTVSPSTEEDFEESRQTPEDATEEAEGLLAGAQSDDAVEVEEADDNSDEEEAEALLAEAEEAA